MNQKLMKFLIFVTVLVCILACPVVFIYGIGILLTIGGYILVFAPVLLIAWLISKLVYRMIFGKVR